MSTKKVKSFIRQFAALIQGETAEVQAEKVYRQASSALNTQIASLGGDTIQMEDKVTDSKEALELARINHGKPITDRNSYVSQLLSKKNGVTIAEEELESHLTKIKFLQEELKALDAEVDA